MSVDAICKLLREWEENPTEETNEVLTNWFEERGLGVPRQTNETNRIVPMPSYVTSPGSDNWIESPPMKHPFRLRRLVVTSDWAFQLRIIDIRVIERLNDDDDEVVIRSLLDTDQKRLEEFDKVEGGTARNLGATTRHLPTIPAICFVETSSSLTFDAVIPRGKQVQLWVFNEGGDSIPFRGALFGQ